MKFVPLLVMIIMLPIELLINWDLILLKPFTIKIFCVIGMNLKEAITINYAIELFK